MSKWAIKVDGNQKSVKPYLGVVCFHEMNLTRVQPV